MRHTQYFGLTQKAKQLITDLTVVQDHIIRKFPDGHIEEFDQMNSLDMTRSEDYKDASYVGMFDDGPTLRKYTLRDGTIYFEFVQASPWSSGPCIFLALKDKDGNVVEESLWDNEYINNC